MPFGVTRSSRTLRHRKVAIEHVETAVGGARLRVHRAAPVASRRVALAVVEPVAAAGPARDRRSASMRRWRNRRTRNPSAAPTSRRSSPASAMEPMSSRIGQVASAPVDSAIAWIAGVSRTSIQNSRSRACVVQRILADVAARVAETASACGDSAASYHARSCRPSWRALVARLCTWTQPPAGNRRRRAADEFAVLADPQAGGQRAHGELVPGADVLLQRDLAHDGPARMRDDRPLAQGRQRGGDVVDGTQAAAPACARASCGTVRRASRRATRRRNRRVARAIKPFVLHLVPERAGNGRAAVGEILRGFARRCACP